MGFELRALHLLIGTLPHKLHPQPFCALVIFQIGSYTFFPGSVSDCYPPTYASSCIAGIADVYHYTWLVCWDGFSLAFCSDWLQTMILLISTSWISEITDVYHFSWHVLINFMLNTIKIIGKIVRFYRWGKWSRKWVNILPENNRASVRAGNENLKKNRGR
jgi:hypothetical protein